MTDGRGEMFREMITRYRAEDMAEYSRGRAEWAERTREERRLAREDRIEAAEDVVDAAVDMLAYGLNNFAGICVGAAILTVGLWLAVTTSTGG